MKFKKINSYFNFYFVKVTILIFTLIVILNINKVKKYLRLIRKKRIGVICVKNEPNPGNMLVKFSMYTKLKLYGLSPIIISTTKKKTDISFIINNVNFREIKKNFSELNQNDYDILMVNSDQTWSFCERKHFYDYAFLRFAENWTIPKFTYAASYAKHFWPFSHKIEKIAKNLLQNFTGISLREIDSVKLVEEHLGIKATFVLDPTFLIDKKYYLNIIKNYKSKFNYSNKYLCVYQLDNNSIIEDFIKKVKKKLNYRIYKVSQFQKNNVENFIFGINISKAVITDSFHGTVFSIIFKKPFISYINSKRGRERFYSLKKVFNLKNRIIFPQKNKEPKIELLSKPLSINQTLFTNLRNISINYLEKNLGIL